MIQYSNTTQCNAIQYNKYNKGRRFGRVVRVLALSTEGRWFESHHALCSQPRPNGSVGALVLFHMGSGPPSPPVTEGCAGLAP